MDKQDELACVIMQAQLPKAKWDELTPTLQRYFRGAAAAVRSFMGSDEVVERAAKAHCDQFGGEGWWETGLIKDTLPVARKAMRVAIRTALGGDGES